MSMMELKEQIVALCNRSGLHIEQVVFVLKDAYRDAEDSYLDFKIKQEKIKKIEEGQKKVEKAEEELSKQDLNDEEQEV